MRYNKALQQRNALLRDDSRPPDNALLDVIDARMAEDGRFIYSRRREFIDGFLPLFIDFYRRISSDGEQVDLRYESHFANCDDPMSIFISRRERDRILGFTSAGAHKDDCLLMLGDCLIRKIGSEGQNKTCLIALKLAQFACLSSRGTTPILLLDDVFDKLDANRVEQIISLVAGDGFGQIFITDTNRKYLDEILAGMNHDYRLFHVENGKFSTL
jgi:DNA replication and repair protein RecF